MTLNAAPGGQSAWPSTPAAEEYHADFVGRTLPELEALARCFKPRPTASIMRSSQLDAERLDEELTSLLREQLQRCFALFRPGLISRLQPEITLLLDFLIFRLSVWEGRPLPGMSLMNLRFRDEAAVPQPQQLTWLSSWSSSRSDSGGSSGSGCGQAGGAAAAAAASAPAAIVGGGRSGVEGPGLSAWQRSAYCLGAVFLRYGWGRLGSYVAAARWSDGGGRGWRTRAWEGMRAAEAGYRLAALLNFLAFLRGGRYRSLLERVLRARPVYAQPSAARAISFEYLNRQLVWAELSELLLFLLPLLDMRALKRGLRAYLPRLPGLMGSGAEGGGGGGGSEAAAAAGRPAGAAGVAGAGGPCGICGEAEPLLPYAAQPCGHTFCYYCLRSQTAADAEYSCPNCAVRVEAMQRAG